MRYKVICTDIDGTLLNKERELSEATIREVNRIRDRVPFILVSSRMPKAMRHLQETLGIQNQPLIAYNGGLVLVYNENREEPTVFLSVPISYDVTRIIYNKVKNTDVHVSLYINDHWYVEQLDAWAAREINNTKVYPTIAGFDSLLDLWETNKEGPHKIMCMGPEDEIHALELFLKETCSDKLNIYRSKSTYLELASKQVSKAVAIKKLLHEHMGFQLEDIVAFGDNYNDIEMLEMVGLGIAVANANDALKKVADEVTLSNLEDGVAVSMQKHFV